MNYLAGQIWPTLKIHTFSPSSQQDNLNPRVQNPLSLLLEQLQHPLQATDSTSPTMARRTGRPAATRKLKPRANAIVSFCNTVNQIKGFCHT